MDDFGPRNRSGIAQRALAALVGAWVLAVPADARAKEAFIYGGEPIHPACLHAVAMHQGDVTPVTTAVSLEGCMGSERSRGKTHYEDDVLLFEDDGLLGGGSFGYLELTQLDNGIYGLAIQRILPGGERRVSLAAVNLVSRAMMLHGEIRTVQMLELLGELWIPGMDMLSFRSVGNKVHFVSGVGDERVERDVDFSRLGRLRR